MIREDGSFKLLRFEPAKKPKKYVAVLLNKKTGRTNRIAFGSQGYENYDDKSGLGLFKGVSHGDKKRRDLYRVRHAGEGDASNFPNAGYWAWHVLW